MTEKKHLAAPEQSEPVAIKEVVVHADYRQLWAEQVEINQRLTAALSAPQPTELTQVCTCPSGDGSLLWPCPTHPPEQPVLAWTDRYGYLFTQVQHEELGVGTIALIAKPEVK
jgi:hypothetical protein